MLGTIYADEVNAKDNRNDQYYRIPIHVKLQGIRVTTQIEPGSNRDKGIEYLSPFSPLLTYPCVRRTDCEPSRH